MPLHAHKQKGGGEEKGKVGQAQGKGKEGEREERRGRRGKERARKWGRERARQRERERNETVKNSQKKECHFPRHNFIVFLQMIMRKGQHRDRQKRGIAVEQKLLKANRQSRTNAGKHGAKISCLEIG